MTTAAVTEEAVGLAICVFTKTFDLGNACCGQAGSNIAFDIELVMAGFTVCKEVLVRRICFGKAREERCIDFITFLRDARAYRTDNSRPIRTQSFHCGNCVVGDARNCALPSGVRGSNHTSFTVGKQHRHAIGGQNAKQYARSLRDQPVAWGRVMLIVRSGYSDNICGMGLINAGKLCVWKNCIYCQPPVFHYSNAVIVAANADIKPCIYPRRNPTLAAKEAVSNAIKRMRFNNFDCHKPRPLRTSIASCALLCKPCLALQAVLDAAS